MVPVLVALLVILAAGVVVYLVRIRPQLRPAAPPHEAVARDRGEEGEQLVQRTLRTLDPATYTSFHGLLVPRAREPEKTTEIDHVVVSPYGVFVIETKSFNECDIHGGVDDETWTLQFRSGQRHTPFNPLRQNRGHANAVGKLLGLRRTLVHPIVVLAGNGRPANDLGPDVVFARDLVARIGSHREVLLDERLVARSCKRLAEQHAATGRGAVGRHVAQLQQDRAFQEARAANRRYASERQRRLGGPPTGSGPAG